ncbi:MAG: LapA family protein [Romboutsia sp.]|nr:LapA family protein [Romboutsia sp.]
MTSSLLIIISIIAIIFALQNSEVVNISFLLINADLSLALVIILSFALGFTVSMLTLLPFISKTYFARKQSKKSMDDKDNQIMILKQKIDGYESALKPQNDIENSDINDEKSDL